MRSGSNLLVDLLDAHPDLLMLGEGLNPGTRYGLRHTGNATKAVGHLRRLFECCPGAHPGTKVFVEQLATHGIGLSDLARSFPTAHWIVLYRRSLTRQLVSLKRARESGDFVARAGTIAVTDGRISLSVEELRQYCRDTRATYGQILHALEPFRPLVLDYETLSRNPQQVFDQKIWPFLGLRPVPVATRLRRQSPDSLEQSLRNIETLRDLLDSSETRLELSQA